MVLLVFAVQQQANILRIPNCKNKIDELYIRAKMHVPRKQSRGHLHRAMVLGLAALLSSCRKAQSG